MKFSTDDMRTVASDINSLATKYQSLITSVYKSLSEISSNKMWTGSSANEYVDTVLLDKVDLMFVGDRIKSFAKIISDNANLLDSNVSSLEGSNR